MKYKNYIFPILILFSVIIFSSYLPNNDNLNNEEKSSKDTFYYFFSGHPYQWNCDGNRVDFRLEKIDYSKFDGIWLGGDVCSEATLEYSTLKYLDSLFDLKNPTTFWTLGNHDVRHGNEDWLFDFTKRETFYTHNFNGLTSIVMNTTMVPTDCERIDKQFRMIKNVCDTIQKSSHLIVLMHHCLLDSIPGIKFPDSNSKLPHWNANCFSDTNSFSNSIYPLFVEVEKKGVDVICIIGDFGYWAKKYYKASTDGVQFLGCGLNNSVFLDTVDFNNAPKDNILIIEHIPSLKQIKWNFHSIDSLIQH